FRDAYTIVGRLVNTCVRTGETLETLTMKDYRAVSEAFGDDIYEALSLRTCVNGRNVPGGPAEDEVTSQIKRIEEFAGSFEKKDEKESIH
ncbi:MAG: hypothetical protein Q8878_09760, partial [Bacillota bacterium]|nr:hypothetical protein [Bacillota bacterium]